MYRLFALALTLSFLAFMALPAAADPFSFNNLTPNDLMATASRPSSAGTFEIEAADDFITTFPTTLINKASFTGLLTGASPTIAQVVVEIYRVFPKDSDVGRTSGPPTFSTSNVPTRVNSPADVAFDTRSGGELSFNTTLLNPTFTALNSVQPGGIHTNPPPGGNGPVTGEEVQFNVTFTTPFNLPPDHYFFIPQVAVSGGEFLWLSASRPISGAGTTPFPAGITDLQSWTRDDNPAGSIDPDWLRVGTDIVGGATPPTFNAAFSLEGTQVPLPGALPLVITGLGGMLLWRCRKP